MLMVEHSNGSSMYINQTGNNKSYTGYFGVGHSFCTYDNQSKLV